MYFLKDCLLCTQSHDCVDMKAPNNLAKKVFIHKMYVRLGTYMRMFKYIHVYLHSALIFIPLTLKFKSQFLNEDNCLYCRFLVGLGSYSVVKPKHLKVEIAGSNPTMRLFFPNFPPSLLIIHKFAKYVATSELKS